MEPLAIREIDIFTFEEKYKGYLSVEQLARELFASNSSVYNWLRKKEIFPDLEFKCGSETIRMFKPERVEEIRKLKNLKEHSHETIKDDFFEFLNEKSYTFSFKMVFLLAFLKNLDKNGNAKIDNVLKLYKRFYKDRLNYNLKVDRENCIYTHEYLENHNALKQSMLSNPFEKFERKRFILHCKELSEIGFNSNLWNKLTKEDIKRIKDMMYAHLQEYYQNLDGLLNIDYLL